jgi:hypothetical protein
MLELSSSQCTPAHLAHEKILKRLAAIEKKLSVLSALLLKQLIYAYFADFAMLHGSRKKPITSKVLKDVTVKVIDNVKVT